MPSFNRRNWDETKHTSVFNFRALEDIAKGQYVTEDPTGSHNVRLHNPAVNEPCVGIALQSVTAGERIDVRILELDADECSPGGSGGPLPTLVDNGNGTYTFNNGFDAPTVFDINEVDMDINDVALTGSVVTFTSEDGTTTSIDICDVVANNCNATLVLQGDGTFIHTANDGVTTVIPAAIPETVTTFTNNGNDTYTYTSEDGTVTTTDAPTPETVTTFVDNGNMTYTYTSEDGTVTNTVPPVPETVTTFVDNGNGTYTYTSEDGTQTLTAATPSQVTYPHLKMMSEGFNHGLSAPNGAINGTSGPFEMPVSVYYDTIPDGFAGLNPQVHLMRWGINKSRNTNGLQRANHQKKGWVHTHHDGPNPSSKFEGGVLDTIPGRLTEWPAPVAAGRENGTPIVMRAVDWYSHNGQSQSILNPSAFPVEFPPTENSVSQTAVYLKGHKGFGNPKLRNKFYFALMVDNPKFLDGDTSVRRKVEVSRTNIFFIEPVVQYLRDGSRMITGFKINNGGF